jgi:hypothetical protein
MSPIAAAAVVCALAVSACVLAARTDRKETILYMLLMAMAVLLAWMVPEAEVP